MEPDRDPQLSELLNEWKVPGAPRSLDQRVLGSRRPWWRFLLAGSIRIPVPVGIAIAVAILVMAGALIRQRAPAPAPASVNLVDFRPASDLNVRVLRNDSN